MARFNGTDYANDGTFPVGGGRFQLALVTGFNAGLNTVFVQFFDTLTPAPADIPLQSILVGPGSNFSWRPSEQDAPFAEAFSWAVSSTANTFTSAADPIWIRVEGQTGQ